MSRALGLVESEEIMFVSSDAHLITIQTWIVRLPSAHNDSEREIPRTLVVGNASPIYRNVIPMLLVRRV